MESGRSFCPNVRMSTRFWTVFKARLLSSNRTGRYEPAAAAPSSFSGMKVRTCGRSGCPPFSATRIWAPEFMARLQSELPAHESAEGQCELRRKTGESLPLNFTALPFDWDGGRLNCLVTFDASDRPGREGSEHSLQSLARLSDENPSPVLRISGDGVLLYANRGSWPACPTGRRRWDAKIPPAWFEVVREVIGSGQRREEELRIGFKTYLLSGPRFGHGIRQHFRPRRDCGQAGRAQAQTGMRRFSRTLRKRS